MVNCVLMMSSVSSNSVFIYTQSHLIKTSSSVSHLLILPRVYQVRAVSSACERVLPCEARNDCGQSSSSDIAIESPHLDHTITRHV